MGSIASSSKPNLANLKAFTAHPHDRYEVTGRGNQGLIISADIGKVNHLMVS